MRDVRQRDVLDGGAQAFQRPRRRQDGGPHLGIQALEEVILGQAQAEATNLALHGTTIVGDRHVGGGGVGRIAPGQHLKQEGRVGHRAGHGAHVVQRPRQRDDPGAAHPAVGGLQPDEAAEGRRDPDGAPGVRPQRPGGEAGRHRHGGTAAAAAGHALAVPRIPGRAVVRVHPRGAVGELVHVELAQQDGTRLGQARRDGRVRVGHPVCQDAGAAGRADAARQHQILQRDGNPVQRPAVVSAGDLPLRRGRGGQRLPRQDRDVRQEIPVGSLNAVEVGARELHGREGAAAELLAGLGDAESGQLVRRHGDPPTGAAARWPAPRREGPGRPGGPARRAGPRAETPRSPGRPGPPGSARVPG